MRRPASLGLISLLAFVSAVLAGCGSADDDTTPAACLNGADAYSNALRRAPGAVTLAGGGPISGCLIARQSAGDLAAVGETMVRLATRLNAQARLDPGGAPTVQLGYLVGAARRGASETSGIHDELVRRLEAAALYSPAGKPPPEPFDQSYEKGYAAGRDHG